MIMAYEWMVPFVALNSLNEASRQKALQPMMLASMPVAPAMRGPLGAVAVVQQVETASRDQKAAVDQTVRAVGSAATTPGGLSKSAIDRLPLDSQAERQSLADRIHTTVTGIVTPAAQELVGLVTSLSESGGTVDDNELAKYPVLAGHFTGAALGTLVSPVVEGGSAQIVGVVHEVATLVKSLKDSGGSVDDKVLAQYPILAHHFASADLGTVLGPVMIAPTTTAAAAATTAAGPATETASTAEAAPAKTAKKTAAAKTAKKTAATKPPGP
jgi:hypothetical protein